MTVNDLELDRLGLIPWKSQTVTVDVPNNIAEQSYNEFSSTAMAGRNINVPDKISFKVEPAINTRYGPMLRTQDYMILNILTANRWKRPLYFAVTVPQSNMVSELTRYMRMDGLVHKIVPFRNWRISPTNLEENLSHKYKYRGLNDKSVYYNGDIKNLLQNYRSGYIQMAEYYMREGSHDKLLELLNEMDEVINSDVIPWTSRTMYVVNDAFKIAADTTLLDSIASQYSSYKDLQILGEQLLRLDKFEQSIPILESVLEINPNDPRTIGLIVRAYQITGQQEKAIAPLEAWLEKSPGDRTARQMLNQIKESVNN
jgi:tetratricopeptide (TPR) repeat protein